MRKGLIYFFMISLLLSYSDAVVYLMPGDCASIQACMSRMVASDILRIRNGTYSDAIAGIKAGVTVEAEDDGQVVFTGSFNPGNGGFTMRGIIVKNSQEKALGSGNTYYRMSFVGGPSCGNTINSAMDKNTKVYQSAFYGKGGRYLLLAYQQNGGMVVEDAIFRPDGGWGASQSCSGWEPHAAYNMYDSEGFTINRAILVDAISDADQSSENIGGQVVNTHLSHALVGTISNSLIITSGEYGRFASDGQGSHNLNIVDSIVKNNGFSYSLTRNCGGTTNATRFDTDASVGFWKGSITRTSGAQLVLNQPFLNDPRWKREMCGEEGVTRGFCGTSMMLGDYVASKIGLQQADTTPPFRSNGMPSGNFTNSTKTISLTTDEQATCRYSLSQGVQYIAMIPFSSTGGTRHALNVSGLSGKNDYYVRCSDLSGNVNEDDFIIGFLICAHAADSTPCDGAISLSELMQEIAAWRVGSESISGLISAIQTWKTMQ